MSSLKPVPDHRVQPAGKRQSSIPWWSWMLALVGCVLLLSRIVLDRVPAQDSSPATPPQLFLAVDGLSWEAFAHAQSRGLFKQFTHSAPMIAPYPSMSHPAWAEIMQTREVFGSRSNIRTVEARWFDLNTMRVADDPRQVIERQASPFNYMRAFDTYFNPLIEPLMYFPGRRLFNDEVAQTARDILDGFTGSHYRVYFSGTDATAHTHLNELHPFLVQIDSMLTGVLATLKSRGVEPELWLVSDHGNAGAFEEGDTESYLTWVSMDAAIERAGLIRRDTGTVTAPNEVAVVTIALASMVNLYFPELKHRRRVASEALLEPGVSLATWLEVRDTDRHVVILGPDSTEAQLRWQNDGSHYAYTVIRGNPLQIPAELCSGTKTPTWIPDSVMRAATKAGNYIDAPHRIVQSAIKQVENAPDLIINLHDGYAHSGEFSRVVRMVRTHGSLSSRASMGVVATNKAALPATVRAGEVMALTGEDPHTIYPQAVHMHPDNPEARAREARRTAQVVVTGRADHSLDAEFLRRAHIVVQSMSYFPLHALRDLFSAVSNSNSDTQSRINQTRELLSNVDVLGGLTYGVDSLIALTDSLDTLFESEALSRRLDLAEQQLRATPGLAPLASLRELWAPPRSEGEADRAEGGGGALARRAIMLAWTTPYFLNAALNAPEMDSTPDPRDALFAEQWHASQREKIRAEPEQLFAQPVLAGKLFSEVFAERKLWRDIEPAVPPLYYAPELSDIAVVLIPGIYGELFDGELWQRGLKAVNDRLGVRTFTIPVDGRCSAQYNAPIISAALRRDIARRQERGYAPGRYLLIGYSKGGVDATHMLLADSSLASRHVAALVTLATPHLGSPVAERASLPAAVLDWAVSRPMPAACDSASSAPSLWPGTRSAFWAQHESDVANRTALFSVSFTASMNDAHPFMKLTKRVGQFNEPNDGVVALRSSRFPEGVPALDLGQINADHIAGITASSFPQEAFMEALVLTLGELGALDRSRAASWERARTQQRRAYVASSQARSTLPDLGQRLRDPEPLPGGSTGWTASGTFRMGAASSFGDVEVARMSRARHPDGAVFRCDQAQMAGFRREYEFWYDAGNGGRENDAHDGFGTIATNGTESGRACQLATRGSAIKMTTVAHRFQLTEFPALRMRLQVAENVRSVDPGRRRRGANDAAFKLWFVLRDTRDGAAGVTRLFGYTWGAPDQDGVEPADGAFIEAVSSKRNLVVTTLPEAWLVNIGGTQSDGTWQTISRNLAVDVAQAFPDVPVAAHEVVGVTLQSDSDESRGSSRVFLDYINIGPQ